MFNRSYIVGHEDHPHYLSDTSIHSLKDGILLTGDDNVILAVIKSLSDPTKYRTYLLLTGVKEISVSDIAIILNLSQSCVSHALSELKLLGLVEARKCGKLICYSLKSSKKTNKFSQFVHKFRFLLNGK